MSSEKHIKFEKKFNEKWLEIEDFKGWLSRDKKDTDNAFCRACNVVLRGGKSELLKHSKSNKHLLNVKTISNNKSLLKTFTKVDDPHQIAVKKAEISLSVFFCEHNIAFNIVDHLEDLLRKVAPDSKILKDIKLSRRKCTAIVKNVLCKKETNDLVNLLQKNNFSVLVDETTDISNIKQLCILVRYVDSEFKIRTRLLELVTFNAADSSASSLYSTFAKCLLEKEIPLKNITGMSCDGASVMVGKYNSFFSRLKNEVPNVLLFKCICHSSALIASSSCDELPDDCEWLLKSVASYLNESSKSSAILAEFQEHFDLAKKKILKPARTRWLVLHSCIQRFLENWTVILNFFLSVVAENRKSKSEKIVNLLLNNKIKAYFLFLSHSLQYFNQFNALFQSNDVLVHVILDEIRKLTLKLGQNFINPSCIEHLNRDWTNAEKFLEYILPINQIYLGLDCKEFIKEFDDDDDFEIKQKCLEFYKTAFKEILKRFDLHDPILEELKFLKIATAMNIQERKNLIILPKMIECNKNDLMQEWKSLPLSFTNDEKEKLLSMSIEEFWKTILSAKDYQNKIMFPNLQKMVLYALTFPHANAEAERIFSNVTDIKTKKTKQFK